MWKRPISMPPGCAYPIEGLVILTSKRHIKSFDELTAEERKDYINLLSKIGKAQREALGERVCVLYLQ
ncbi:diadenosine tetraphosphate (Ap4A) HIT family hydrolase [Peribacillus deserti]|uniref:Diadenosine tetraphosphate (Ap4A) HIT family hydrolase n=1 Tax=Peribacillus deserti TaxID=673318 RepID=A0ABS2QL70_9BACI|nr:diadenosine tetraphosphate (Ap4A) HIT family hydrolase [Peribacillus deserti]